MKYSGAFTYHIARWPAVKWRQDEHIAADLVSSSFFFFFQRLQKGTWFNSSSQLFIIFTTSSSKQHPETWVAGVETGQAMMGGWWKSGEQACGFVVKDRDKWMLVTGATFGTIRPPGATGCGWLSSPA
ncbi:Hypp6306 [Branchiostoma lanceolatum]|uniref:Hypp6306 protein n=1 Tax=Branchiostoma lanceolatum TaxID=7740 RepID=A0A8J9YSW0_BRALA|nr:Hypp6306 [Branchiostoma lanceolatum]